MKDNFDKAIDNCFPEVYSNADGEFWKKLSSFFGIKTGRRKECKEQGLNGKEKRQCARELKARGWKKGQPIPADMAGITAQDVVEAEKYPPLPTEIYVSPYAQTPYTAVTKETENGIETYYPEQPAGEVRGGKPEESAWDKIGTTGKVIAVVGASALLILSIRGISKSLKSKPQVSPTLTQ